MDEKKPITMIVRIKEVKLLGFQVTEIGNKLQSPLEHDQYQFDFEINSKLEYDSKELVTILNVILYEKSSHIEFARLTASFNIFIVNDKDVIQVTNGIALVPDNLLKISIGTAISTVRGMFVLCATVHKFSNAIVPLINIDEFLKKFKIEPEVVESL